ncbi:glycosyl transferase [Trichodelitschia bisporula]|uniref:Glycosyl transferase n=1 Tax=Trichodelitschia bisporula TaxID=703511 RepID=A0A6G1I0X8_9PEZI|nr:glycosyl transferase [Trichodelitschia bisporula]
MAEVLDIKPFADGVVARDWWQWALISVIAASGVVGGVAVAWFLVKLVRSFLQRKTDHSKISRRIAKRLRLHFTESDIAFSALGKVLSKPTSFGVYLGTIHYPPNYDETRLLSRYDLIVLDPSQAGVLDALSDPDQNLSPHVVGRLDLYQLVSSESAGSDSKMLRSLERILGAIDTLFRHPGAQRAFTGLLLAGWRNLPAPVLNSLAKYLSELGFDVYLEVVPPHFLEDVKMPDLGLFAGMLIRNGTILPNGQARDFFQMEKLKSTTRAFVSQACLRPFTTMIWDTVDDRIEVSHAVVKRSYAWCGYHGALVWIGSEASVMSAEDNMPVLEPLAAFQWLKDQRVMKIHEAYRLNHQISLNHPPYVKDFEAIECILPSIRYILGALERDSGTSSISTTFTLQGQEHHMIDSLHLRSENGTLAENRNGVEWVAGISKSGLDPLSISLTGANYTGLGCFPVGLHITDTAFAEVVKSQRRLRRLGLLIQLSPADVRNMAIPIQRYLASHAASNSPATAVRILRDLVELLNKASDLDQSSDPIQIYKGIDSGFHGSASSQFWSVFEIDRRTGGLCIYVSKNTQDMASTVMHTYLSYRSVSRYHCLLVELDFHKCSAPPWLQDTLPVRLNQDLDLLSPTDVLLFLQQYKFSTWNERCPLLNKIKTRCEEILLETPTFEQLKQYGNVEYLRDSISTEDLVASRVKWYRQHGFEQLDVMTAQEIFTDVHFAFRDILHNRHYDDLDIITNVIESIVVAQAGPDGQPRIDPYVDILLFSLFCAARKAAFEEVYVEVQDRNPLFNEFSDQSAAFAELFALGSRCEAYFDVSPSSFGKLLSDRHRAFYTLPENQPPMWINNAPAFASAYAAAQTDIDPEQEESVMPGYRKFTFLSVFAIPALVDIILLTTIKRGLYLSGSMSIDDSKNATLALMVSLLLSGAIGTWISIGGTYYLISMAFSAANMFILTRLVGGLAFTVLVGLLGLIGLTAKENFRAGVVFFFYLIALTSYLSVLAALSSYQFPGSSFLNGRTIIIGLIPTLLASPLVTVFVKGHDTVIYLVILYAFIGLLFIGLRSVGSWWVTWLSEVYTVDDAAVKKWYVDNMADGRPNAFDGLTDPAAMSLARQNLANAVEKERKRPFWRKSREDEMVQKLTKSWDATVFLLNWYCRLSDVRRPMPYSSTWNIEVRVAYDSLMQNQKGIRLHNSFIHWRNAGDEVGCGILYFLVALMDRWVGLVYKTPLLGLTAGDCGVNADQNILDGTSSPRCGAAVRVAVGFGLAYYLIGAVLLDYKAQHLHQLAQESTPITIQSKEYIRAAEIHDAKIKRRLYWRTLFRFLGVHVWALALCSALVWVFDSNRTAFITFIAYIGAYSGLLLYQYNKIFSGPHAMMPLLTAVLLALPLGLILKKVNPGWAYNEVVALAVATWTAAVLSLFTAKITIPPKESLEEKKSQSVYHAYCGLGIDQQWSQSELEAFYVGITTLHEKRFTISPHEHPGTEIKSLLLSCNEDTLSALALDAFPAVTDLARRVVLAWDRGLIVVELASMRAVIPAEADVRAISYYSGGRLHILVDPDSDNSTEDQPNIGSNCRVIAETLIHAVGEAFFGLNHEHALISESLLVCRFVNEEITRVPERLRRALPAVVTVQKKQAFLTQTRRELLRYLCYGLPCDTTWHLMPLEIRRLILRRALGEPCSIGDIEWNWLEEQLSGEAGCALETRTARYDLGAILAVHKFNYFRKQSAKLNHEKSIITDVQEDFQWLKEKHNIVTEKAFFGRVFDKIKVPLGMVQRSLLIWVKFLAIAPIADPEYQRELNCVIQRSGPLTRISRYVLPFIWIYSRHVQSIILPWFIFKGRADLAKTWKSLRGKFITLKQGRLTIQAYQGNMTAFIHQGGEGSFKLFYYSGIHEKEPRDGQVLAVNTYSKDMRLMAREEFEDGRPLNEFVYKYSENAKTRKSKLSKHEVTRIPLSRTCTRGFDKDAIFQYNHKGFVESGCYTRHGNLVRFKYHYRKNAKYDDELLRAEFVLPHLSANVSWAAPPIRHPEKPERWIPHSRVQEATFVQNSDVYECLWVYNHQYHPVIQTKLNGVQVETPEMIRHDWLGLLKKPDGCTFLIDNPLLSFPSIKTGYFSQLFRYNAKVLPSSTSQKRSQLWKIWKKRADIDGVVIRWLDERLLREDSMLKPYWRKRDRGALDKAEDYLALHADTIMASSELSNDISAWTPLAIRLSDLFSFGQGGDAVVYTRTKMLQPDTEDTLHVIAVDTGTWPNEGGGVSACRRDLINNLRTIRWNMVVESANDFGLPKHQTQENVESLKVIPLWGLDFMHPVHGMFFNKLDSEVDHLIKDATREDIKRNFVPTLTALVKGARAITLSDADVKQATRALVNLNTYFQDSRHWKEVWESDTVKESWRQLWLADDIPNTKPPSEWFDTERPTLGHLDSALELWFRYLFIFSIPIPERVPAVFQASHHSVSAAYGIVCKIKRNCVLQIWDHAISWRETNLYLSSALCTLPPFIRNSLLGLMRLTSMLTLHHADHILPCADFFNPGWETEIGTSQGTVEHRNVFKRKIDPVVNGITDMQKFAPVTKITTTKPTVTMLSHVWFAKDIKTALLAADVIVNQWGFDEYHLDIYGALNKAPIYSSECQEIIATKGLAPNVTLRGSGDPGVVLSKTWLFLNSSVSEGLPLALGEAALTGAPVVCTDVGASLRVLTHPESNERYSEIVAPNDPLSLARAQINLLAMLGQWSKYANDEPGDPAPVLPINPTRKDVDIITTRMYAKTDQRRALGMMAREIVQTSFSGERYLREHEQMLWVGKARYESYGVPTLDVPIPPDVRNAVAAPARTYAEVVDAQLEKMAHPRAPWVKGDGRQRPGARTAATSFTSVYEESAAGASERVPVPPSAMLPGDEGRVQVGGPSAGVGRTHSERLSFAARMREKEGKASRVSTPSRYVPSTLSEVHNASDAH